MFNKGLNIQAVFDGNMQSVRDQVADLEKKKARIEVEIRDLCDLIAANLKEGERYGLKESPVNALTWQETLDRAGR